MPPELTVEEEWYKMITEGESINRHLYHLYGLLPSNPCGKLCASPFKGWGGFIMLLLGRDQSKYNQRFCQSCEILSSLVAPKCFDHAVRRCAWFNKTGRANERAGVQPLDQSFLYGSHSHPGTN
jgi:hypothetical protein